MTQGIRKNNDAYVMYDFSSIKCAECGIESNPFVHKEHLTADEQAQYVQDITGFKWMTFGEVQDMKLVKREREKGGLYCPMCLEEILKECVNG